MRGSVEISDFTSSEARARCFIRSTQSLLKAEIASADVVVGKARASYDAAIFLPFTHSTANPGAAGQTTALWSFKLSFFPLTLLT